jgi:hypothetical protein
MAARLTVSPSMHGARAVGIDRRGFLTLSATTAMARSAASAATLWECSATDPAQSVVDPHQEYHTVQRLCVCDASTFSGPISVDPSLTIMAWSYVAAQHMKTRWEPYKA